jgi:hypothetical protein
MQLRRRQLMQLRRRQLMQLRRRQLMHLRHGAAFGAAATVLPFLPLSWPLVRLQASGLKERRWRR